MENKVFNRRIILWILLLGLFVYFTVTFFLSGDTDLALVFLVLSLFLLLGVCLEPLYFEFNKKEIVIVWLFPHAKRIAYADINSIREKRWGECYKELPKYEIIYRMHNKERVVVKQFDLPRNKKIGRMLKTCAKSKWI